MIDMDIAAVAAAVAGRLVDCPDPSVAVTGAAADTRRVAPGDLYVAIVGERVDGHDLAETAAAEGAVVTLAQRPTGTPAILVDDPVQALGRLARHVLDRLPTARVVAVTGSSGKTTTKDLIATLAEDLGPTVATEGSFNTEVGMPLTILRSDEDTRFLVLEMGARGLGHIQTLCQIARPQIGLLLNVGTAHLGEFGSREAITRAKAEIVADLPADGLAILNADDPLVAGVAAGLSSRVVTFGTAAHADVRIADLTLDDQARPRFTLHAGGQHAEVAMAMVGEHMAGNAAAAAAVGLELGLPLERIAQLLAQASPRSRWRMEVATSAQGVTVVNDAYNANPDSMRTALRSLAAMGAGRRTFAVLGAMAELGEDSIAEHDAIGRLAVRLDISRTIAVGEAARPLYLGAAQEGSWADEAAWVPDPAAAVAMLRGVVGPGDVVLVKASRSVGLESVAESLLEVDA